MAATTQPTRPPRLSDWVAYTLSETDATAAAQTGGLGNPLRAGDVYPALIVRTWGDQPLCAVNLQVFVDGPTVNWATSRTGSELAAPGHWHWPSA